MHTQTFAILVLTESNFTKQSALSTGRWVECFKILIEHTHFKKKSEKRFGKIQIYNSYEDYKNAVIVHNHDILTATAELC